MRDKSFKGVIRWLKSRKSNRRELEKSRKRKRPGSQKGDDLKPQKRGIFFK